MTPDGARWLLDRIETGLIAAWTPFVHPSLWAWQRPRCRLLLAWESAEQRKLTFARTAQGDRDRVSRIHRDPTSGKLVPQNAEDWRVLLDAAGLRDTEAKL